MIPSFTGNSPSPDPHPASEIYTLSLILNSLGHKGPPIKYHKERSRKRDTRLAHLFVSKDAEDIAAISVIFTPEGVRIWAAKTEAQDSQIRGTTPIENTAVGVESISEKLLRVEEHGDRSRNDSWLTKAVEARHYRWPTLANYVEYVERLLGKEHESEFFGLQSEYPEIHYLVHFFCLRKEYQRLVRTKAPKTTNNSSGTNHQYLMQILLQIKEDDISSRFPGEDNKVVDSLDKNISLKNPIDEKALHKVLYAHETEHPSGDLPFIAKVQADLWKFFTKLLRILRKTSRRLRDFPTTTTLTVKGVAKDVINITRCWELIYLLVYRSRSFSRLLQNDAIYEKLFSSRGVGTSSSDSIDPLNARYSRGKNEEPQEELGELYDKQEDKGRLSEEEQEEDDNDETDALNEANPGAQSMKLICLWLKRSSRVIDALHLLLSKKISSVLQNQPTTICPLPNPPREDITQLSLRIVLECLSGKRQYWRSSLPEDSVDTLLQELMQNDNMKQFEHSKKVSSIAVHCESMLAAFLKTNEAYKGANISIGVSSNCCYVCRILLESFGFRSGMEFHNKVYPWAPPLHLESRVIQDILEVLRTDCIKKLEQIRPIERWSWADAEPVCEPQEDEPYLALPSD